MKPAIFAPLATAGLLLAGLCLPAHAQTGVLNDTGQTSCYDASNATVACDNATTGNAGTLPHQDGRYGRDAAATGSALTKTSAGAAGFDFTLICWNGVAWSSPNCGFTPVANTSGTPSATPATDWACIRDNTTGLLWSLQTRTATWDTASDVGYADAGHNSANRCGYSSGWRLPTTSELLSIVFDGSLTNAAVHANYFPNTQSGLFWAVEPFVPSPGLAWVVDFSSGGTGALNKTSNGIVRLVRGIP